VKTPRQQKSMRVLPLGLTGLLPGLGSRKRSSHASSMMRSLWTMIERAVKFALLPYTAVIPVLAVCLVMGCELQTIAMAGLLAGLTVSVFLVYKIVKDS